MKLFRKLRKDVKAISPIISVLLMIAVAVVAALVTYAWVMGYIGFTTNKTGKAIQIQSIANKTDTGTLTVYVQNVGDSALKINPSQAVYINGALQTTGVTPTTEQTLEKGDTLGINTSFDLGHSLITVTVKVTSEDGTFNQVTQQFP